MKVIKSRAYPNAWRVPAMDVRYPTHFFLKDAMLGKNERYIVCGLLYSREYKKWKPEAQVWNKEIFNKICKKARLR